MGGDGWGRVGTDKGGRADGTGRKLTEVCVNLDRLLAPLPLLLKPLDGALHGAHAA